MEYSELIYLDNAATGFPKPAEVIGAVGDLMTREGGNAGRGGHPLAMAAAERIFDCRVKLSEMFDANGPEQVCFTMNTTQGLNLCIKGLLKKGDHVLISDMEHNAVYRPLYKLQSQGIIELETFPIMLFERRRSPEKICAAVSRAVRRNTRMLVCTGASNISSVPMPIRELGALCHRLGILFVVDGAQSAGHIPMSVKDMKIDALCFPGHKGLLGPQGCGAVILGEGIRPSTLVEGGNGVDSLDGAMVGEAPERYEAGTLPAPAIAGLSAGLDVVRKLGIERIERHEKQLFRRACDRFRNMRGVRVYTPEYEGPVLLFNLYGKKSEETARLLAERGICVRGGYHCTALGHKTMGTENGGAVRASFGPFNSSKEIDMFCDAVQKLTK